MTHKTLEAFSPKIDVSLETCRQCLECMALYLWHERRMFWNEKDWDFVRQKEWIEQFSHAKELIATSSNQKLQEFFLHHTVFTSDSEGNLVYFHHSFFDYLVAKALAKIIAQRDNFVLKWRLLSLEILEFLHEIREVSANDSAKDEKKDTVETMSDWHEQNRLDYRDIHRHTRDLLSHSLSFLDLFSLPKTLWFRIPLTLALLWIICLTCMVCIQGYQTLDISYVSSFGSYLEVRELAEYVNRLVNKALKQNMLYMIPGCLFCAIFLIWTLKKRKTLEGHLDPLKLNFLHLSTYPMLAGTDEICKKKAEDFQKLLKRISPSAFNDKELKEGVITAIQILEKYRHLPDSMFLETLCSPGAWQAILPQMALKRARRNEKAMIGNAIAQGMDLSNISFDTTQGEANLAGLRLKECNLSGWHARKISLQNVVFHSCSLQRAELPEANLEKADLRWCDLSHADMSHAVLKDTDLRGANLRHAILTGANLQGARIRGADFSCAVISAEGSEPADLSQTQNIQTAWWKKSRVLRDSRLPQGFSASKEIWKQRFFSFAEIVLWLLLVFSMWFLWMDESGKIPEVYFYLAWIVGGFLGLMSRNHYPELNTRIVTFIVGAMVFCMVYVDTFLHPALRFGTHGAELWGLFLAWSAMILINHEPVEQKENQKRPRLLWLKEKSRFALCSFAWMGIIYSSVTAVRIAESILGQSMGILWLEGNRWWELRTNQPISRFWELPLQISVSLFLAVLLWLLILLFLRMFYLHRIKHVHALAFVIVFLGWLHFIAFIILG